MKPLGKGAKRTALADNVEELMAATDVFPGMYDPKSLIPTVAVVGGAVEQALTDIGITSPGDRKDFWLYLNNNIWRLTRSLKASGLIKEIK